jgi:hypothetical protein
MSGVVEQTGADVIHAAAGVAPVDPQFPVPYADDEIAWKDAGFFSRRYGKPIRVVHRDRLYWLAFVAAPP